MDGIRWLFAPVFSLWTFLAIAPHLFYWTVVTVLVCAIGYFLLNVLRFFSRK